MINICIPSYKRCGKISIFKSIPQSYSANVFLYVRKEEQEAYTKEYGHACTVVPLEGVSNIGTTRQAIIAHQHPNRILMIDDDVTIHEHFIDHLGWLRPQKELISESAFYTLIATIEELMDKGAAHGGLRTSIYSANFTKGNSSYRPNQLPYKVNAYTFTNTWYDLSRIPQSLFKFNEWSLYEDLSMWAYLIDNGFDSARLGTYITATVFDGNTGGVWETRTIEAMNNYAIKLKELYPKYVQIKQPKGVIPTICGSTAIRLSPTPKTVSLKKHRKEMLQKFDYYIPLLDPNRG